VRNASYGLNDIAPSSVVASLSRPYECGAAVELMELTGDTTFEMFVACPGEMILVVMLQPFGTGGVVGTDMLPVAAVDPARSTSRLGIRMLMAEPNSRVVAVSSPDESAVVFFQV